MRISRPACGALATLALSVAAVSASANGSSDAQAFARAPAFAFAALSADGARLSYVQQSQQHQHVTVRRLSDQAEWQALSLEPSHERVRWCGWSGSRYLLCGTVLPVRGRDRISERTRLYSIDTAANHVRELNGRLADPIRDQVIDLSPAREESVLLQHDSAALGFPEVAELDVVSGALRTVVRAHAPVRRWLSDGRGAVRSGVGHDAGVASIVVASGEGGPWRTYRTQALDDPDAIAPIAFGPEGSEVYALKHHNGRTGLFRVDAASNGTPSLLFADAAYDVAGPVVLDKGTGRLLGVRYVAQEERTHFFDATAAGTQVWIDQQLPGRANVVSDRSLDNRHLLLRSASDVDPPSWYVVATDPRKLTLLGHDYPQLETRQLAEVSATSYRARDGQVIPAYLTLPLGRPAKGLPAVVLPHGGPETRDALAFDPLVQFLAADGYAVLQMNFRGSFGYGASFAAAGAGQWGGVIHNDITDGARWLVEQGIADPALMCIVGVSFGGYAALLGAARESQWYACAASYAGVTDLLAFSQYVERLDSSATWRQRLGTDGRGLWQMSPLARLPAVETPVFMMHGRTDPIVPVSQGRRFARALRNAGKAHRFVERGDCDHELTIQACRAVFFTELQTFLAEHLPAR